MPEDTVKMIDKLNEDSTVADFKTVVKAIQEDHDTSIAKKNEEIQVLSERIEKMIQKYSERQQELGFSKEEKMAEFLKSAWMNDIEGVSKYGGFLAGKEWKKSEQWNIFTNLPQGAEKAALGTVLRGDAVTGSYIVPTEWYAEVMRLAAQASTMMGKVTTIPMSTRQSRVPTEATSVSLAWPSDESSAKTETTPTFGYKDLAIKTCAAWMTWTEELEEDATINIVQYFQKLFAEAWGAEYDKQVLAANTAPFVGMLYDTGVNVVTMGTGKTSFADISYENLIDLQDAITKESAHVGAMYIMHRKTFNYIRKLKDDNGNPIYDKPADGVPATVAGAPYILCEQMPTTSAVSTAFVLYGNPKYWIHGEKVGLEFKIYRDTVRNVDYDQIFLRFRTRQGFIGAVPAGISRLRTAAS